MRRRPAVWALGFAYAAAWGLAGWLWTGPLNDLDYFFMPAVRIALGGQPLHVYAVRFQTILANDNGPLGLVPLTAVGAVVSWLGWLDDDRRRRMVILAGFSIFTLLMAREAVTAIDRLRGKSLGGLPRILAYGVFVASPTLWLSVLGYGHVEQPMTLWLVLLGVRSLAAARPTAAGISFGLAILTRSLAALPLIPVGLLLLARRRWLAVTRLVASAAVIVVLGVLPFLLADSGNTIYSLVTHRGALPPSGGSIWLLAVGTGYEWIPQRADVLLVFALAALAALLVIRMRPDLEPTSADIYGVLGLTAIALPLLAKSVWPYYFLDAYVFGAIWWLGQTEPLALGRGLLRVALPLVAVLGTLLTEWEMGVASAPIRIPEGVAIGSILAVVTVALIVWLRRA